MDVVFANQLEACDYYHIDIMSRDLSADEQIAINALLDSSSSGDDPSAPTPAEANRIRERSPDAYRTPERQVRRRVEFAEAETVQSPPQVRRATRVAPTSRANAQQRAASIAGVRRPIVPIRVPEQGVHTASMAAPVVATMSSAAPGPLTLPPAEMSADAASLPQRSSIQAQVAPGLLRAGFAYHDAIVQNIDVGGIVNPYVVQLDADPRHLPSGIPSEHAAAWRRLVQVNIMIAHYAQLIMTECEVHIALEQTVRILNAYNGLGVRRLFQYLRQRADVRATHIYDLHNCYKRFFIAAAAQLNRTHLAPTQRVSHNTQSFTRQDRK
jgi:hypothetical protein